MERRSFFQKIASSVCVAGVIFLVSFSQVDAFSCTSNGTGGGNFNLAATWSSCNSTTPQTTDSITIASGDTVTLVATTTVAGITINSSAILAANTRTLTNTAAYTNNGSHTGTTSAMTLSGVSTTIDGGGTYSPTGVVTMSTGAKTIASTSVLSFARVTITGVTVTNNSTAGFTVTTALVGTGQLTQGASSILNLRGTSTITTLDASINPNEVHYTSTTAAQTIKSSTYHHLFIDKLGQTGTLGGVVTVNGNLTVTAGNLADGGFQVTGNGTGTLTIPAASTLILGTTATATSFPTAFTSAHISLATTSTVNYNSSAAQTISSTPVYGNLTTTATSSVTKTAAGALTVNGLFTNGTNNIFADGGFTITLKDGCTMTGTHIGAGKILFSGGAAAHAVSGAGSYNNVELDDSLGVTQSSATTIGGTLTITSGTWTTSNTLAVTGTATINGTLSITATTGTKTFNDITIASGGTFNFAAAETLAENGTLTISNGGTMNFAAAGIMNVAGDLMVNGTGVITGTTGLWTFSKVGGGTLGGTVTSLSITGNVTFATQYVISYPLTVNGMTVNSGVVETNPSTVIINGTLAGTGTFTQNAGTALSARSVSITTLNATATGNIVHYIGAVGGTLKGTSYVDLDINKSAGFTATANGTVNVAGNLSVTSGTISFASSIFTVTGATDIYGTLTDSSGGSGGGNNVFHGLVTVHSGAVWNAVIGEVCDFHFGNGLVMNGASFVSSTGTYYFETNNQSITGSSSFTIDNLAVTNIQLTNSSSGTLTIRTGLFGTGEFIQGINAVLNVTGASTITTFTASATGNTVNYNGAAAQTVHAGTYQTLKVDNNSNGNVNITSDATVSTALTLGGTLFTTSTNKIILGTAATWSRTSGYVYGTVSKTFNASTSFTFPIGDATNYSPLDLTLAAVTNTSSIDASVTATDHVDTTDATSDIKKDESVNRFWSLKNNGLKFGSYGLVLHFLNGDIDVGSTLTSMTIAKKSEGSWAIVSSTCLGISCMGTGLTSMSDFQIGVEVVVPVSAAATPDSSPPQKTIATPVRALLEQLSAEPAALFDIISSPLLLPENAILFPVIIGAFLIGTSGGFLFLVTVCHRRRYTHKSRMQKLLAKRKKSLSQAQNMLQMPQGYLKLKRQL
jgi:hypothetical protein